MVLCLTHSGDFFTIDIVQQQLRRRGIPSFRLDTDQLGVRYRLRYDLHDCVLDNGLQTIRVSGISAVWYRKLWELKTPPDLDPAWRDLYTREYLVYRHIFLKALQQVPWINKMDSDHAVNNNKLWQLQAAQAAGLRVPRSIFTNDATAIRDFFVLCNNNVIMKLHGALSKSMSGNSLFFPTTKLNESDLSSLDQLAYCPMIFQEYIPKAYELRIAWVQGECFTGKIPYDGKAETDWRTIGGGPIRWQPYELPRAVQLPINSLMQALDLSFGAIDMIRDINGDYVFLEVNPQGEWGMLQKYLGFPIGETIADKLISAIKS